jgi:hypothetical protein
MRRYHSRSPWVGRLRACIKNAVCFNQISCCKDLQGKCLGHSIPLVHAPSVPKRVAVMVTGEPRFLTNNQE